MKGIAIKLEAMREVDIEDLIVEDAMEGLSEDRIEVRLPFLLEAKILRNLSIADLRTISCPSRCSFA